MESLFTVGNRTFTLDQELAMEAFVAKKVINGRATEAFNLLPLKYPWAYDLYRKLKNANWSPFSAEIVDLIEKDQQDREDAEQIPTLKILLGFLAPHECPAEALLNSIIREKVTAPELKLVLGRRSHEENITSDCFLFLTDRLRIDPVECAERFHGFESIRNLMASAASIAGSLSREMPLTSTEDKQRLAQAIFYLGACFKGLHFHSLYATAWVTAREGKFPASAEIIRKRMKDEGLLVEFFRRLLRDLLEENPNIHTPDFEAELVELTNTTASLEKAFARECFETAPPVNIEELCRFIDFLTKKRLEDFGFKSSLTPVPNPFSGFSELKFSNDFTGLTELSPIDTPFSDSEL